MEFSLPFPTKLVTCYITIRKMPIHGPPGVIVKWAFWLQSLLNFTPSYYSQIIIDGTLWDKLSENPTQVISQEPRHSSVPEHFALKLFALSYTPPSLVRLKCLIPIRLLRGPDSSSLCGPVLSPRGHHSLQTWSGSGHGQSNVCKQKQFRLNTSF